MSHMARRAIGLIGCEYGVIRHDDGARFLRRTENLLEITSRLILIW
jgi:hypothetical protein